jgi:hypothetical protein
MDSTVVVDSFRLNFPVVRDDCLDVDVMIGHHNTIYRIHPLDIQTVSFHGALSNVRSCRLVIEIPSTSSHDKIAKKKKIK